MESIVERLKLFDIRLKSGASSPCGKDDFKNADIHMYNVLMELIHMCTPHECKTIINQHVADEKNRFFMLDELRRFYAVASALKSIEL